MARGKAATVAPVRSGRKDPGLLAQTRAPKTGVNPTYVCGIRPLLVGHLTLMKGVEVPGAGDWPRLEAWVSARRVLPVGPGADVIPFEEYRAAWEAAERLEQERVGAELTAAIEVELSQEELAAQYAPAQEGTQSPKE